ncbi:MAG: box helicase protein, partial [Actinomycetota bacterium]|nr:box helicase protein [Actinomycetota bacterium]
MAQRASAGVAGPSGGATGEAPGASGTGAVRWDAGDLLERLAAGSSRQDRLLHVERVPARPGVVAEWPEWADPGLVAALRAAGI